MITNTQLVTLYITIFKAAQDMNLLGLNIVVVEQNF